MPLLTTKGAASAAGLGFSASSGPVNYIEDVFSTYLYTGNGSTQTITNGIDLSTKGGLVWLKYRTDGGANHIWTDTVRGATKSLYSNATDAQATVTQHVTGFTTSGFSVGNNGNVNDSGGTFASWTFRKQPKFFDVVTWVGDGTGNTPRTISHNLGSTPGFFVVKKVTAGGTEWICYHRSLGATKFLRLNDTPAAATNSTVFGNTEPTSTTITVGGSSLNDSGNTFVAYLFAHNAGGFGLSGAENVITCGSFVGSGSSTTVNLGFEPQWVMIRASSTTDDWRINDNMRGVSTNGVDRNLAVNLTNAEYGSDDRIDFNATGFTTKLNNDSAGETFIYVAIRRGPMKVPTSGTSVFAPIARNGTGAIASVTGGFAPDLAIAAYRTAGEYMPLVDKLRGPTNWLTWQQLITQAESAGYAGEWFTAFTNTGMTVGPDNSGGKSVNTSGTDTSLHYYFQRAPKFFDVVAYTGDGNTRNITHNLGAAPELIIIKQRNGSNSWYTYVSSLPTKYFVLSSTSAASDYQIVSATSATTYTVGGDAGTNGSSNTYVAYLFATCPGVSKVGSYTGTGAALEIDCGFTSGARFVFLKRTDGTGPWYMWDTARGIVAGNDPYISTSQAAETTITDYIDPYSAGFAVTADSATVNTSGGNYIFLAIA